MRSIDLKFRSYDRILLEETVNGISSSLRKIGADITVIPLPSKRLVFSVGRCHHIYKKSSEQFAIFEHVRLIRLYLSSGDNGEIKSILTQPIPSAVRILVFQRNICKKGH